MANTSVPVLRVSEIDFFSLKENFKTFLQGQSQFTDFRFDGSGINVILDLLSYNSHILAYYLNCAANEAFLDTSQVRASTVSHAKNLCYTPTSKRGSQVTANVVVTPSSVEDQSVSSLTLARFTKFLAQDINGINYPFVAYHSNNATKVGGSFSFNGITLRQGEVITLQYTMDGSVNQFSLPSANVDTETLLVTVQESLANTFTEEYKLVSDITEIDDTSRVYFVEEDQDSKYILRFGDNILGKKPSDGNIVIITYLDTVGSVSNNISKFYQTDPIGGLFNNNVRVQSVATSFGGSDKETIEQVRFRAPYFYTAQNRMVNKFDYETLLVKDYPNIDSVSFWGGEDNDPVIYGKVFLALKTRGNYQLSNLEKETIKTSLIRDRNVVGITPEIVDPDYVYLLVKGTIYYNPSLTSLSPGDIAEYVKASITDYNNRELNSFKSTFRKSKLQGYMEAAEKSILGSDIAIYAQKRLPLNTSVAKSYDIAYNMVLGQNDINNRMFTTPEIQSYDFNGVSRNIYFEEKPFSSTGVDSITIITPGLNYTSAPPITITGDGTGATATAVVRNGRITKINITNSGTNYTRAEVVIGTSGSGTGSGASAIARLENKTGIVRSYYFKPTGEKVVLSESAGTINYETGLVSLATFLTRQGTPQNRYYDTDTVAINFPLGREVVLPLRNRILTIDGNDPLAMQIQVVAET